MKNAENGQITLKYLPQVLLPTGTVVPAKGNILPCGRQPFARRFAASYNAKDGSLKLKGQDIILLTVQP